MHGQAIQSILTTPIHPYCKQISENKKKYKSYQRKKNNPEVGNIALNQLSTIRLLPQGSPLYQVLVSFQFWIATQKKKFYKV